MADGDPLPPTGVLASLASRLLPSPEGTGLAPASTAATPRAPPATAVRSATAVVDFAAGTRWSEESGHAGGLLGGGRAEEARSRDGRRKQLSEVRK